MAPKEMKIMRLLMDNVRGLYGSELVHLSNGYLSRGSVYTLLSRLVDKGYITEIEEPPTQALMLPRTRHKITALGESSVREYAQTMGFELTIPLQTGVRYG
jgi:DNA-binding PadR family transcriptional regulator